jgi:hypothetical protein
MLRQTIDRHLELTLERLPTAFSRLAFLSSVRDPSTGRYLHEGWFSLASPEEIHEVMRKTHLRIFGEVLSRSLNETCSELGEYLRSITEEGSRTRTVRVWLELESYREMIPVGSSFLERELFFSQIRAALRLLALAPEIPSPAEQSAWQSQQLDPQSQRHRDN